MKQFLYIKYKKISKKLQKDIYKEKKTGIIKVSQKRDNFFEKMERKRVLIDEHKKVESKMY